MRDKPKTARGRAAVSSFLVLVGMGCSSAPSTSSLLDGGGGDAAAARDLDSPGDLATVPCKGNETFTAARTAMLSGCSGFAQFSCHGRSPFDGNLDLTAANAYKDLVGVAASIAPTKLRVQPGNSAASFLMQKLTNTQGANEGGPMPDPVEGLKWSPPDPAKLAVLRCWIDSGAPNN